MEEQESKGEMVSEVASISDMIGLNEWNVEKR